MTGIYRYMFYDILTNSPTIELPLYGTWFTRELCKSGNATWTSKLGIGDPSDADIIEGTIPGRTKLYVERNGRIVWSGIVWTRTWQESSKSFSFTGQTLESYTYSQIIENTLTYAGVDQRNIVCNLFSQMQAKPYSNLGITIPASFSNVITRSTTFNNYDGWSFGRALEYMAEYDQGVDFAVESRWGSNDTVEDYLRVDNILGVSAAQSQLVFDFPGSISSFWYPESASRGAISMLGFGKGEGTSMVRSKWTNTGFLNQGWPEIQRTYDNKDVSVQSTLDSQTAAAGIRYRMPVVTPTIQVNPDVDPTFDSFLLGDNAVVNLVSRRFPEGHQLNIRIIGWELTPSRKGSQEEQLKLILAEV